MKKKVFVSGTRNALIGLCCLLALCACTKKEAKKEVRLMNVQIQPAEKKSVRPYLQTVGTLNPFEEVTVSAEVEGMIKDVRVAEGTVVGRGTLLAAIDDTDYVLEHRRAAAALKQAEATLANTRLEYRRKDALHKEELVTRQQFEDVQTRLALAEAEFDRAKAALSLTQQKLTKTKVGSPIACSVKEKKVSIGDYVKNGTPLFSIIQCNPLKLHFTVPEKDLGALKKDQEVTLGVSAFPAREFKGKVNIIYPSLDDRTRTVKVEALVPNDDGVLKPGLFARVVLYTAEPQDKTVVPITSLLYEGENVTLFVVEGDTARERTVKIGNKYGEVIEVLDGVKVGENVVVAGQQSLSDGAKVRIQTPAAEK